MPITLSGNRISVTYASGDAKGDSLVNAWTFSDIKAASDAGGWLVTQEGSQFYIPYSLYITGATFFKDNGVSVNIEAIDDLTGFYIYPSGGEIEFLNCRFYTIITRKRVFFRTKGLISNCLISGFHRHTMLSDQTLTLKDSVIDFLQIFYQQNYLIMEDVRFTRLDNGLTPTGVGWTQDGLEFMNSGSSVYWLSTAADFTVRNLKVKVTSFHTTFYVNTDSTGNLIDCENDPVPHRVITAAIAGTRTNIANFQSTFRWLLEQADVSVKVYDKDDNLVLDKFVNSGDEDVLTFAKRTVIKIDSSTATTNTLETFEPFKVVLAKEGYLPFTINQVAITRGTPTIIRGSLVEIPAPVYIQDDQRISSSLDDLTSASIISENDSRLTGISALSINSDLGEVGATISIIEEIEVVGEISIIET